MNDRERLIALLKNAIIETDVLDNHGNNKGKKPLHLVTKYCEKSLADYLIANGVTIQKQGRWEFKGTAYACSECGTGFPAPVSYCFGCGAKMAGGEDAE